MVALFNYLALIGAFLSASLVLPALVAFGTNDLENGFTLLIYAAIGSFFSGAILLATRGRAINLDRIGSIYLAIISWIVFPLILAIPISDLFKIQYVDAIFEAVSAFTTTAADGIQNLDAIPPSALFLRSNLQWTGGLATLLTFVLFLGPIRAGGLPKPRSGSGEAAGRTTSGINRTALGIFRIFLFLTIVCFVLLMLTGIDAFSALILASTAVTAGGYLPSSKSLVEITTPLGLIVMSTFFVLASLNIFWQRMVQKWQIQNLKHHRESYYIGLTIALLSFAFLVSIVNASGNLNTDNTAQTLSESVFNATSLVSTSGLQSRPGIFVLLSPLVVFGILLIGGGCYSLAGGIKFYRIGAMLFHAESELTKLIYPHSVAKPHFGSEAYSIRLMKSIWTMFAAFMCVMVVGAGALSITGLSFQASFTASIAAITNAGPAYSIDWVPRGTPGWLAYFEMSQQQKMILSIIMVFGRLEVIAIIVALNPTYWLRR
ncbi:MAG: potassium transporter TrkG [Salaquimonas sp.]